MRVVDDEAKDENPKLLLISSQLKAYLAFHTDREKFQAAAAQFCFRADSFTRGYFFIFFHGI